MNFRNIALALLAGAVSLFVLSFLVATLFRSSPGGYALDDQRQQIQEEKQKLKIAGHENPAEQLELDSQWQALIERERELFAQQDAAAQRPSVVAWLMRVVAILCALAGSGVYAYEKLAGE